MSGKRRPPHPITRLRRFSQILFLALFLFLLVRTELRNPLRGAAGDLRLPHPVSFFLEFDPLAALATALSTGSLYGNLWWALAVLVPTLFLGRLFCGWVCPLGTLSHWVSGFRSESKRGRQRVESSRYRKWQTLKYYVLAVLLGSALFGGALWTFLDPISLTVRSLALSFLPGLNYAFHAFSELLYRTGWHGSRLLADGLHLLLGPTVLSFRQPHFRQGFLLGALFLAILALNLRVTRFWCRALCPLGALLGLASRWSILGLVKQPSRCDDCHRCLLNCQGGDDPLPGAPWRKAECHLCLNCLEDCPEAGLSFRFFPPGASTMAIPDLERRRVLSGLAAGACAVPLLRANAGLDAGNRPECIRPPGALPEKEFLARCIRCGQCMKVCPNNALQPTLAEAGVEGFWSPVLVPRIGYCEPGCVLCGSVCPTGAIWKFTGAEKGWVGKHEKPIRVGTAFFDRGRCLPWAMATECIVCEEWCPTSPKAIYLLPAQVKDAEGNVKLVRQPYLDPQRCVGCGACEHACPVRDKAAVYVTSVGESRSATNQILLSASKPARPALEPFPASDEVPGWTRSGPIRSFEAADLWKHINGGAERYLQAGVVRTFTAGFRYRGRLDAVADVYLMRNAQGAAAILESEPPGGKPLPLGDGARHYGPSLIFRKGPYLVRLVAYEAGSDAAQALAELARGIERRITS